MERTDKGFMLCFVPHFLEAHTEYSLVFKNSKFNLGSSPSFVEHHLASKTSYKNFLPSVRTLRFNLFGSRLSHASNNFPINPEDITNFRDYKHVFKERSMFCPTHNICVSTIETFIECWRDVIRRCLSMFFFTPEYAKVIHNKMRYAGG